MSETVKCHGCGIAGTFSEFRAHGLFCSDECRNQHANEADEVANELIEAGFTKHSSVPNLWTKDGVAVSQEQAHRGDIKELLAKHQSVVLSKTVGA